MQPSIHTIHDVGIKISVSISRSSSVFGKSSASSLDVDSEHHDCIRDGVGFALLTDDQTYENFSGLRMFGHGGPPHNNKSGLVATPRTNVPLSP